MGELPQANARIRDSNERTQAAGVQLGPSNDNSEQAAQRNPGLQKTTIGQKTNNLSGIDRLLGTTVGIL
jgi:hypothetical protein